MFGAFAFGWPYFGRISEQTTPPVPPPARNVAGWITRSGGR